MRSDPTNGKTSERIANEEGYCCEKFKEADSVNWLFNRIKNSKEEIVGYEIRTDWPQRCMKINYCPWCTERVPMEFPNDD